MPIAPLSAARPHPQPPPPGGDFPNGLSSSGFMLPLLLCFARSSPDCTGRCRGPRQGCESSPAALKPLTGAAGCRGAEAAGKARGEAAKKRVFETRFTEVLMNKFTTTLTAVLVALIVLLAFWLIQGDKDTAGLLAIVTALVPVLSLLLRPKKDPDSDS